MKKSILLLALFAMSLFVVACGNTSNTNDNPNDQNQGVEDNNSNQTEDNTEGQTNNNETSNDETNTGNSTQGDTTNQGNANQNTDDEVAKMQRLDYIDFELQVDYAGHQEYEVELELSHNNRVKAEIEDDINGVKKKGPQAFDELYPLVEQLTITQSTSKEDAIQEVLKVFNLDSNYEEFEIEIKFNDGTKIEYKDEK